MTPKNYSTLGIILFRRKYSEADRILTIYTKSYGLMSYMAKGVRKTTSRKRGHIEVFSKVRLSAANGRNMDVLTEVETINSYDSVRKDLNRVSLAYFYVEAITKLVKEEEKNLTLFKLLDDSLKNLPKEKNLKNARKRFIEEALTILGFWPRGKGVADADSLLENITERELYSIRVGKKVLK